MSEQPRLWHKVIGGDPEAAVKYGLTLKARCGIVWQPEFYAEREERPEITDCPTCYRFQPVTGPDRPHYVYRCYDAAGELLYVGCTVDLNTRRLAHSANSWWFPKMDHWRVTIFPNKLHARRIENAAIRDERPLCNTRGQDFGSWPAGRLRIAHDLAVEMEAATFAARVARAGGFR